MSRLKKMLSEKQKKIRRRNYTLILQITVLGWMVEIFGFLSTRDIYCDARAASKENAESDSKEETKEAWLPNPSSGNGKKSKISRQREIECRKTQIEQHSDDSKVRKDIEQNRSSQDMYVEDLDVSHDV